VTAVIVVEAVLATLVAGTPPIVTPNKPPATKFVPVIVIAVLPAVGPVAGAMLVNVGAAVMVYVYTFVPVAVPPGVVTITLTTPAEWKGVVAVIDVSLTTVTLVAAVPPRVTPVAPVKPDPVIVTLVPPAIGPVDGAMMVNVGTADT
jgi:hypothetical protein